MINKKNLVNKYVTYVDRNGKYRTEKVVKVFGDILTVVSITKVKHRIHKDKVIGRQFPKRGIEPIEWSVRMWSKKK